MRHNDMLLFIPCFLEYGVLQGAFTENQLFTGQQPYLTHLIMFKTSFRGRNDILVTVLMANVLTDK